MKILLLTDGIYPYMLGGMQKHSYYLAKYLAKNRVNVDLCHCVHGDIPDNHGADNKYFTEEELAHIHFRCFKFPVLDRFPGHYPRENKLYSCQVYNSVKEEIQEYDLIYTQGYTGWEFIEERKNGLIDVPIMVNFHGLEMYQKAPSIKVKLQHFLLRPATKWNVVNADYVSSFGGKITQIIKQLGVPDSKIIELPIGIESSWLNNNIPDQSEVNAKRKFVFIGRYERRKGIEELNSALKQLLNEGHKNFEFHFIGPIPEDKKIVAENIIYYNEIRQQEKIQELLSSCDILVCPSYSEGMPTVILEAMAKGLAIIATRVGAVEKEVQGNGWLMDSVDVGVLKNTLKNACNVDAKTLTTFQQTSVELIKEKFLWDKVVFLMMKEFERIIQLNILKTRKQSQ